jgi:2-oxoglutarate ferredoxin oxidoreductase subunit alpha
MELLEQQGIVLDAMRIKAFPFNKTVENFIEEHEQVFVIEQNRDAQFRSLLVNELEVSPKKLISILNYDGMPITADTIMQQFMNNSLTYVAVNSTNHNTNHKGKIK